MPETELSSFIYKTWKTSQCGDSITQWLQPKSLKTSMTHTPYPIRWQSLWNLLKCIQNLPLPTTSTHPSHNHLLPDLPASALTSYSLFSTHQRVNLLESNHIPPLLKPLVQSEAPQKQHPFPWPPRLTASPGSLPFLGSLLDPTTLSGTFLPSSLCYPALSSTRKTLPVMLKPNSLSIRFSWTLTLPLMPT